MSGSFWYAIVCCGIKNKEAMATFLSKCVFLQGAMCSASAADQGSTGQGARRELHHNTKSEAATVTHISAFSSLFLPLEQKELID